MEAVYYDAAFGPRPKLLLRLTNIGSKSETFTVTAQHYSADRPLSYQVAARHSAGHAVNPLKVSDGWYDLTVRVHSTGWSRRYVGQLENGSTSITG